MSLLSEGYNILKSAGADGYHTDAQILLAKALSKDRLYVLTNPDIETDAKTTEIYFHMIKKRAAGCPLAYLTGVCEFYGREFDVTPDVLIPRADTEVLVEAALELLGGAAADILEIGAGSGCIAVSLALENKNARVTAVDISKNALVTAKKNAKKHGADITFIESDIYAAVPKAARFDMIISNPPYIRTDEIKTLDRSVRDYEPICALDGGADGLFFYEKIIGGAGDYLKPGGAVLLEIGCDMAEAVKCVFERHGFTDIKIRKDYAGRDRVIYYIDII